MQSLQKLSLVFVLTVSFYLYNNIHVLAQNEVPGTRLGLRSPDKKLKFVFYQKSNGCGQKQMKYTIFYKEEAVIKDSDLGILIDNKLFESALAIENDTSKLWCENIEFKGVSYKNIDTTWVPIYGERNKINDRCNQMTIHFEKFSESGNGQKSGFAGTLYDQGKNYKININIRVYNYAVAFRYHFPETKNGLFLHITGEQTNFVLPEGTMAYYERWAQGPYQYLPLKNWPDECERPLTMRLKNGIYISLMEAQMVDYCRTKFKLSNNIPNCIETSMYDNVDAIPPYNTPWRVVMIASSPAELLENNDIVLCLNTENQIKNTTWIKPGKVFRSSLNMKEAIESVDFAAKHNIQYVHLDAGWYGPEMKMSTDATTVSESLDINIQKLVNYAASKNIGIILYINQRALYKQLDEILPLYHQWGIKGLKFGFVNVGSNRWTVWLHEAITKAADYQLMVNVHDEYRPTGFSRTYPNFMTQEGIRGNEEMPDATHNTILPFTRFLAGAADYTICYYSTKIKTTHAHQLALSVIYYSPLQYMYWYDKPSDYQGEKEIEFFDNVKTVWDDTKVLNGEIGEYISIARRSGEEWFVGTITNTEKRNIVIPLNFLKDNQEYIMLLYEDNNMIESRTKVGISEYLVNSKTKLSLFLQESGGAAIHIVPIHDFDTKNIKKYNNQ